MAVDELPAVIGVNAAQVKGQGLAEILPGLLDGGLALVHDSGGPLKTDPWTLTAVMALASNT